jgi:hypothetical protein
MPIIIERYGVALFDKKEGGRDAIPRYLQAFGASEQEGGKVSIGNVYTGEMETGNSIRSDRKVGVLLLERWRRDRNITVIKTG